jgi:uncharacterized membrane protein
MPFRRQTTLIIPLVLCVVAILQDIAMYKMRQHIHNVYQRAGLVLLLNGVLFGIAAAFVAPRLRKLFERLGKESRSVGELGLWIFYAAAYGLLFYVYLVIEKYGIATLLPKSMR